MVSPGLAASTAAWMLSPSSTRSLEPWGQDAGDFASSAGAGAAGDRDAVLASSHAGDTFA